MPVASCQLPVRKKWLSTIPAGEQARLTLKTAFRGQKRGSCPATGAVISDFGGEPEFLKLLWILEVTLAGYPEQAAVFQQIVSGPLMRSSSPPVPPALRKAPKGGVSDDQMALL